MAIPTNRTPVRVARGAAVKFTETIDGVAGAGAKALEDGEIVWDETNEKFQLKVGGSSSTTLKDHTVNTTNLAALSGANFTGDVTIELDDYLFVGGSTLTTATLLGRSTDLTNGGTYGELRQGANEDLYIQGAAGKKVAITSFTDSVYGPDSEIMAEFIDQGAVKLYYDQANNVAAKLATTATGVDVEGTLECNVLQLPVSTGAGYKIQLGAGGDEGQTRIYQTQFDGFVIQDLEDTAGKYSRYLGQELRFGAVGTSELYCTMKEDGAVELYYDNVKKFETTSSGVTVTGAAVPASITALTDGATIATDLALNNNYSVTLAGNRTLGQPTNQTVGQSGSIFITQDGTGSRTLAYHADWKWAGGTAPTLSTAAASVDRIDYIVAAANKIHAVATLAVA